MDVRSESLLSGRKGLVVGIANEQSIAYGCARMFRKCGAELGRDLAQRQGAALRRAAGARALGDDRNAARRRAVRAPWKPVFDTIRERWGRLDFRAAFDRLRACARPARPGRRYDARGLRTRDGHLVPLVRAHGAPRRTADGQGRNAAHDERTSAPRKSVRELRRHGPGEGGARGGRPVPRDRARAARHPRERRVARIRSRRGQRPASRGFDELLAEDARRRAPLPREVEIDDVGSLCAFLVSDAAQAITGDVHYVDGGFHILA